MRTLIISLLLLTLSACSDDEDRLKYFDSNFYPFQEITSISEQNSIFINKPISLRLESRFEYEDRSVQGTFEPIIENSVELYLDRAFITDNDTISSGSNLFLNGVAEIEIYTVSRNSDKVPDSYIIWIDKQFQFLDSLNRGYYTVYIKASTKNSNLIHDSTIVQIEY
jgi:hypothetical protein